jgi:hypothetical protein
MRRSQPGGPWQFGDLFGVALGNLAGLAAIVAGYVGASHEAVARQQVSWVNLGVVGLVLVSAANGGWLLAGRRACGRLRHALLPVEAGAPWPGERAVQARSVASTLVAAPAMTWYHRPDCHMVAGKDVSAAGRPEHQAAGRRPCGVCRP